PKLLLLLPLVHIAYSLQPCHTFLASEMKLSDIFMICLCQDKNANKYLFVGIGICIGAEAIWLGGGGGGHFTQSRLSWNCSLLDYCA
ncbi:unnamed protein product, partial [Ceratitis capitata]